jgi:hypothetical protein
MAMINKSKREMSLARIADTCARLMNAMVDAMRHDRLDKLELVAQDLDRQVTFLRHYISTRKDEIEGRKN